MIIYNKNIFMSLPKNVCPKCRGLILQKRKWGKSSLHPSSLGAVKFAAARLLTSQPAHKAEWSGCGSVFEKYIYLFLVILGVHVCVWGDVPALLLCSPVPLRQRLSLDWNYVCGQQVSGILWFLFPIMLALQEHKTTLYFLHACWGFKLRSLMYAY